MRPTAPAFENRRRDLPSPPGYQSSDLQFFSFISTIIVEFSIFLLKPTTKNPCKRKAGQAFTCPASFTGDGTCLRLPEENGDGTCALRRPPSSKRNAPAFLLVSSPDVYTKNQPQQKKLGLILTGDGT